MTKQMLIYSNAVPINVEVHKNTSVRQNSGFDFAAGLAAAPLVAAEFASAARDLTIVFSKAEDGMFPFAVLGVENGTNLFVKSDGSWDGRYVPAFLRRYPFVFARSPDGSTMALCVDSDFDGLNEDGIGERLFDAEGTRTQYLDGMLGFATQYQTQFLRTMQFCKRLEELDLLEPITALVPDAGNTPKRLGGIYRIDRAKLKAIDSDTLAQMFAGDELELCYLHLQSLTNLEGLREKVLARGTTAETAESALEEVAEPVN
ncbi:SapC family protein [Poseidonocella sedimentorum]|uniref:SapC protein n=1 Tax=Poseidonocella sedimentorum TaxID=871652 RepID=A0A1I6ECQ7_9RHOB|nr:SapC family protein [Poseidonocella sedimentorum]SFR15485.1 SapC protein [Poseidonocella sedimentorum]